MERPLASLDGKGGKRRERGGRQTNVIKLLYGGHHVAETNYLEGFTQLHHISDPVERASVWRQSLATLAAAVSDQRRYVPLEGLDPSALAQSVRVALSTGLLDDVSFLSRGASGAALYELANALPAGRDKREIGRRVLTTLRSSDGETFVGMATQIAIGAPKALSGAAYRARVALALHLPIGASTRPDALALALLSRRALSVEWLRSPSMESLPSRRLAARLLERAAREAAHRASEGDDSGVRIFETPAVQGAWDRLLADRESLVWRHVATARGLLSASRVELTEEIERHLGDGFGITEWRRAAASVAASIAVRPAAAARCRSLLDGPIFKQDPGIAAAMIMALPRAAEVEPGLAGELLEQLVRVGGLAAAEELVELRREKIGDNFGEWAALTTVAHLKQRLNSEPIFDEGVVATIKSVIEDLEGGDESRLGATVDRAVECFLADGPIAARPDSLEALDIACALVDELEEYTTDEGGDRQRAFQVLRELDRSILASDALANLLCLASQSERADASTRPLGDIFQRLTGWLVIHEGFPHPDVDVPHFMHRMARIRSFLHLIDADGGRVDDRSDLLRGRRLLAIQVLFARIRDDKAPSLRRALCASVARVCDALVREETCEVSDVLLVAGRAAQSYRDLQMIAEASMVPDMCTAFHAYARLERSAARERSKGRATWSNLEALSRLAYDLPVATSPRVEALRHALLRLLHALDPLTTSDSLREIVERAGGDSLLTSLESAVQNLAQLSVGAARRLGRGQQDRPSSGAAVRFVDVHLERRLRGHTVDMLDSLAAATETLGAELPQAIADVVAGCLHRLSNLPLDAARSERRSFADARPQKEALPAWVPPSRVIGGFYLDRAIGSGAVGSVFVARRTNERDDKAAEQFALKVPDYSGAAARTLSEEEFLDMFRQEAGALLSLPSHTNLARFVTFDAGARPKPLLVMELVEGPNLERVIETGDLSMERALDLLEGVAAGLAAMHGVGVAHLDLKPSNVIVRDPDGLAGPAEPNEPVLVDFGLAGRQLRPGCGTASYGAPEVWGHDYSGKGSARPADVYAFGCLAYELITGRTLFEEVNDLATITAHLSHDGMPASVGRMTEDPRTRGFAELIRRAIRRNGADRVNMRELHRALARLKPSMQHLTWPLQV